MTTLPELRESRPPGETVVELDNERPCGTCGRGRASKAIRWRGKTMGSFHPMCRACLEKRYGPAWERCELACRLAGFKTPCAECTRDASVCKEHPTESSQLSIGGIA